MNRSTCEANTDEAWLKTLQHRYTEITMSAEMFHIEITLTDLLGKPQCSSCILTAAECFGVNPLLSDARGCWTRRASETITSLKHKSKTTTISGQNYLKNKQTKMSKCKSLMPSMNHMPCCASVYCASLDRGRK